MSSTPRRPTNVTTQLAKERNREAAERTLTSWIQNCLSIIGFGAGFESISAACAQAFPENDAGLEFLARTIGLTAIGLGILLLVLMVIAYRAEVRSLEREDYFERSPRLSNLGVLVSAITLYGLIAFVAALFVLPWK
ncbi:MAG: YidH family protein [Cyanophyceae cyanobacterium]